MKIPNKVEIKTFFDSDRAILIVCIFIALVFWVLVKLSQTFYTTVDFSIDYQLPAGKSFVSSPPTSATATLKGSGWDLISNQFNNKASNILFEINDVSSQAINAGLLIDKFQQTISSSIEVSDVNMDFIFVQMENETEIKVPIKLLHNITLAPQFQFMDSIMIEPDSIVVTGPLTEVQSIVEWETDLLDLKDLKNNQVLEVSLKAPKNNEVHLSQNQIIANIAVEQYTEKSFFLPITFKNVPDSIKAFPEKTKLNCIVGLSKYNDVNRMSFQLVADLKGITPNNEKNTIPIVLTRQPDYVRNINFIPNSVEFFFVETKQDSITVNQNEVIEQKK